MSRLDDHIAPEQLTEDELKSRFIMMSGGAGDDEVDSESEVQNNGEGDDDDDDDDDDNEDDDENIDDVVDHRYGVGINDGDDDDNYGYEFERPEHINQDGHDEEDQDDCDVTKVLDENNNNNNNNEEHDDHGHGQVQDLPPQPTPKSATQVQVVRSMKTSPHHPHPHHHHPHGRRRNIVHEVLYSHDLSRAGSLYSFSNSMLLRDFSATLHIIKEMIDDPTYITNLIEQSTVEIVLTKLLSSLRETRLLVKHYDEIIGVLVVCLKYELGSASASNTLCNSSTNMLDEYSSESMSSESTMALKTTSAPHVAIVSNVLSSLLLDYMDPELCVKSIPVCMKLLQRTSIKHELVRETCSYLNLIAARFPELLVDYVSHLANAILGGHTCLCHLLFQICEYNIECVYPLTRVLVTMPRNVDLNNDTIYIFQIVYLISLNHIQLIIEHLDELIEFLNDEHFSDCILDIVFSVANQQPEAIVNHLAVFAHAASSACYHSHKVDKILGTVGKLVSSQAEVCANMLIDRMQRLIDYNKSIEHYFNTPSDGADGVGRDRHDAHAGGDDHDDHDDHDDNHNDHIQRRAQEGRVSRLHQKRHSELIPSCKRLVLDSVCETETGANVDNNNNNENYDDDADGTQQVVSARGNDATTRIIDARHGMTRKSQSYTGTIGRRDANDEANLERAVDVNRKLVYKLNEVFTIVQAHPSVLDVCAEQLFDMFPSPTDISIRIIMEQLKQMSCANSLGGEQEDDYDDDDADDHDQEADGDEEEEEDDDDDDEEMKSDMAVNSGSDLVSNSNKNKSSTSMYSGAPSNESFMQKLRNDFDSKLAMGAPHEHDDEYDDDDDDHDDGDDNADTDEEEGAGYDTMLDAGHNHNQYNGAGDATFSDMSLERARSSSRPPAALDFDHQQHQQPSTTASQQKRCGEQEEEVGDFRAIMPLIASTREDGGENDNQLSVQLQESSSPAVSFRRQHAMAARVENRSSKHSLLNTVIVEEDHEADTSALVDPFPTITTARSSEMASQTDRITRDVSFDLTNITVLSPSPVPTVMSNMAANLPGHDVVQTFCTKHLDKIRNYVANLTKVIPIPEISFYQTPRHTFCKPLNDLISKKKKVKKVCTLHFYCSNRGEYCLFSNNPFEIVTVHPATWIHITFLSIQSTLPIGLSQQDPLFVRMKSLYDSLNEKLELVALLTSAFPSEKQIRELIKEMSDARLFDLFENRGPAEQSVWFCHLCSEPSRLDTLLDDKHPLIQGQLKEKHGKYKFLKRWHKRQFTLADGRIIYFKKDMRQESLNVKYIRSIQKLKSGGRNVENSFEIFTEKSSFILKAENSGEAEQWIQYLQLSKAMENVLLNSIDTSTNINPSEQQHQPHIQPL